VGGREVVLSRRVVIAVGALILVASVISGPAIASALNPRAVADAAALVAQREAAERALARGYAKAVDQLRQVRALRLPISDDEAERITSRALEELRGVRRSALATIAAAFRLDAAQYLAIVDPQLEASSSADAPGVLLAPELYRIVLRANELSAQIADAATRELTRARTPSPSPTGR